MFGNLGAFVDGNTFMSLFGADVGLKLPAGLSETAAGEWTAKALAYVGAVPPKVRKK